MPDSDKLDLSMFLEDYLNDAREGFQEINSALLDLEKDHSQTERLDEVFRVLHTLKSSSTMLEFSGISELAHLAEDLLDRLRKNEVSLTQDVIDILFEVVDTLETMVSERAEGTAEEVNSREVAKKLEVLIAEDTPQAEGTTSGNKQGSLAAIERVRTVRVHVDLLDSLFNLVGELIITKNRIDNIISGVEAKALKSTLSSMGRMINELQEDVSAARLVPVDEIFRKFPRMVRDMAREQGKEIELILEGREIELDKAILDAMSEPLIHLLRNSVDHGIEPPEDREVQGKPRLGTIKLIAQRAENHILIHVEDDGAGIDIPRMKQVAVSKGFVEPDQVGSLADKEVLNLLFSPGFSSAGQVTGLSGRGVGLDVVRTSTRALGGTVKVSSQAEAGTRFTLQLPLSTAILQTLMVGVGEHVFAIPSDLVIETLEIKPGDLKGIRKDQVLVYRKRAVPFITLQDALNLPGLENQEHPIGVVLYRGDEYLCLGVDTVLDQMENIVKPFDPIAQHFKGLSGGTILGDGSVALLLDIPGLLGFEAMREEIYAA